MSINKYQKQSIKKYDKIATNYDQTLEGKATAKSKVKILEMVEPADGDKVLDVGCGNGSLIGAVKKKANIEAYGVDVSSGMIEECRERFKEITFQIAVCENLPFEDEELDIITMNCVLHHLKDPQAFYREAHRVLKPNGTLLVGELWYPAVVKQFVDWIILPLLRAGDNKLFSHGKLKRMATDNGFSLGRIYKKGSVQIVEAIKEL
ncbi:MAG: class I SAM-dependent methyltransferase [Firmicutes bacterium]|nr:class I SAM-dependent methyltransferase [Bacillota bacterium]